MRNTHASIPVIAAFMLAGSLALAQGGAVVPDLSQVADGKGWKVVGRKAESFKADGRNGVHLDQGAGNGLAWLEDFDFADGTIEVDLKGRDVPQASFVGVAFRIVDGETHDAVYFRPFNFKSTNEVNRSHSVQYVSHPIHTWQKLRTEKTGVYENQVNPVPDPEGWFHARITVSGSRIQVFVNDATSPSLSVESLSARKNGRIGLWVGNGSDGWFANLKITR
jgi:hypothetical protein